MNKKILPYALLVVLALVVLFLKRCNVSSPSNKEVSSEQNKPYNQRGLNRNPSHINYSKHARCRMQCRHIDENEVNALLKEGEVNYKKSDLKGDDCHKRYAVEGYSKDNQHLRIIFAPCNDEVTVVTCIDLSQDWECNCEGEQDK